MGPDAGDVQKQRERELAWERKRRHRSRLAALSGSNTPVSIHTYVPENMVVDVPEDDNRSVIFLVQNFHLEHCSTPIPRTDDVREGDCIQQRHSRSNRLQTGVSLDRFENTVLTPLRVPYVPLHQQNVIHAFLDRVRGFENEVRDWSVCMERYYESSRICLRKMCQIGLFSRSSDFDVCPLISLVSFVHRKTVTASIQTSDRWPRNKQVLLLNQFVRGKLFTQVINAFIDVFNVLL